MSQPEYRWRQLTPKQRAELLAWRKERGHPWHSPPHRPNFGHLRFHITAACFEHRSNIGHSQWLDMHDRTVRVRSKRSTARIYQLLGKGFHGRQWLFDAVET